MMLIILHDRDTLRLFIDTFYLSHAGMGCRSQVTTHFAPSLLAKRGSGISRRDENTITRVLLEAFALLLRLVMVLLLFPRVRALATRALGSSSVLLRRTYENRERERERERWDERERERERER